MEDLAIYGAGGFGREVACLINRINEKEPTWHIVGFYDDKPALKGKMISHYGLCLGGVEELNAYDGDLNVVVVIGNPAVRKTAIEKIQNPHVRFPNIIHPDTVYVDRENCRIGRGNVVQANCTLSCDVTIGDFNVLNGSVVLGHDVKVGSYNTIMPAVRVSGEVSIGNGNMLGVGSIVLQQLIIGNNVSLGAGSVLMTKPKDGQSYIGNPAKVFRF